MSKGIISLTEYLLVYTKNRDSCIGLFGGVADGNESQPIIKRTNRVNILSIPANVIATKLSDGVYPAGSYGDDVNPIRLLGDVKVEGGVIVNQFKIEAPFTWSQSMFNEQLSKGAKFIINTMNFQIRVFRKYEDDNFKGFGSLINGVQIKGTNEDAYEELERFFGIKKLFDYSKPTNYIKELINASSHFDMNSIVLDFFSGSSTTAHAVMQLNAEDGGNRKFIMVQLPEQTDEDSEAYKAGYKNICEIGKERIRRAGKKILEEQKAKQGDLFSGEQKKLDVGFRVFKCADSNMKDVYYAPADYTQELLLGLEDNIKEDRNDLDLLFGCMLDWGVTLDLPLRTEKVDGVTIHIVNEGDLVACFDHHIPESVIDHIASLLPMRVVLRDSCFNEAKEKMNFFEIFKQRTGWSEEEVRKNVKVI